VNFRGRSVFSWPEDMTELDAGCTRQTYMLVFLRFSVQLTLALG
jgi:hypothetical protein